MTSQAKSLPEGPGHTQHVNVNSARSRAGGGNKEGQRLEVCGQAPRGAGTGGVGRWARASGGAGRVGGQQRHPPAPPPRGVRTHSALLREARETLGEVRRQ